MMIGIRYSLQKLRFMIAESAVLAGGFIGSAKSVGFVGGGTGRSLLLDELLLSSVSVGRGPARYGVVPLLFLSDLQYSMHKFKPTPSGSHLFPSHSIRTADRTSPGDRSGGEGECWDSSSLAELNISSGSAGGGVRSSRDFTEESALEKSIADSMNSMENGKDQGTADRRCRQNKRQLPKKWNLI